MGVLLVVAQLAAAERGVEGTHVAVREELGQPGTVDACDGGEEAARVDPPARVGRKRLHRRVGRRREGRERARGGGEARQPAAGDVAGAA